jgi:hypothetical protein
VTTVTAPTGTLVKVDVSPDGGKLLGTQDIQYGSATKTTLTGREWDRLLQSYSDYTIAVLTPAQAASAVSAAAAGTEVLVQPLNVFWSLVTTITPTTSTILAPAVQYSTVYPWSWPPVLVDFQFGLVGVKSGASGDRLYLDYTLKEVPQMLCKATVSVAFYATSPVVSTSSIPVETLAPTGLRINWPGVAAFQIPECLHGGFSFVGATGSDDPVFESAVYGKEWEASRLWSGGSGTDADDWPASLIVKFDVQPYRNGFVVTQVEVQKPY